MLTVCQMRSPVAPGTSFTSATAGNRTFTWDEGYLGIGCPTNNATYYLYVSGVLQYSGIPVLMIAGPDRFAFVTVSTGNVPWSVVLSNGRENATGTFILTVAALCISQPPTAVTALSPAMANSPVNNNPTPSLTWTLGTYGINCDTQINTQTLYYRINSGAEQAVPALLSMQFPVTLSHGDAVTWRIVTDNGNQTVSSTTAAFTTCIDAAPSAPVITLPNNNSNTATLSIPVTWISGGGRSCLTDPAVYSVEVSSASFNPTYTGVTSGFRLNLTTAGSYQIRVSEQLGVSAPVWSQAVILVLCQSTPPSAVSGTGINPADGSTIVNPAGTALPTRTLSWPAAVAGVSCQNLRKRAGELTYDIYLGPATVPSGQGLALAQAGLTATQYDWTPQAGSWEWLVTAHQAVVASETPQPVNSSTFQFTFCNESLPNGLCLPGAVCEPLPQTAISTFNGAASVTLRWEVADPGTTCGVCASACRSIRVEFASCPGGCGSCALTTTANSSQIDSADQYQITNLTTGIYCWQVTLDPGGGRPVEVHGPIEFEVCQVTPPVIVDPDFLRTPLEGTLVPPIVNVTWVTGPMYIDWSQTCGLQEYEIYVKRGGPPGTAQGSDFAGRTSNSYFQLTALPSGQHFWQVRPKAGGAYALNFSSIMTFTVCADVPPLPIGSIGSPRRGAFVTQPTDALSAPLQVTFQFSGLTDGDFGIVCFGNVTVQQYQIWLYPKAGTGTLPFRINPPGTLLHRSTSSPETYLVTVPFADILAAYNNQSNTPAGCTCVDASNLCVPCTQLNFPILWEARAVNMGDQPSTSQILSFAICSNTAPPVPVLPALNTPDPQLLTFNLSWPVIDFGLVCLANYINKQIIVQLDDGSGAGWIDAFFLPQDRVSGTLSGLKNATDYQVRLRVDTGVFSRFSAALSFRTRDFTCENYGCVNSVACVDPSTGPSPGSLANPPDCVCADGWNETSALCDVPICPAVCENGGICVIREGAPECDCTSQYDGDTCTIRVGGATSAQIGGGVAAAAVLILILIAVIILLWRRKKKSERLLIDIEEPDFAELAIQPIKVLPHHSPARFQPVPSPTMPTTPPGRSSQTFCDVITLSSLWRLAVRWGTPDPRPTRMPSVVCIYLNRLANVSR